MPSRNAPSSDRPEPSGQGRGRSDDAPAPLPLGDLLSQHLNWLEAYLRLKSGFLVRGRESTADLAQSVCREILQDADDLEFTSAAAFRSCLLTAADRKIIERHRYHTRLKRDVGRTVSIDAAHALAGTYASIATPSEAADVREQVQLLEECFDELPEDYRQVILLFHVAGLPHEEVAEHLGRSVSASRNLLSRALARLGRILRAREQDGDGDDDA